MSSNPYGLYVLHDSGTDATVDVVFVHGLRGHYLETWTKDGVLWPKSLLAIDIQHSRIMTFGYDSAVVHRNSAEVTQSSLENDASNLCSLLSAKRTAESVTRPIILVAHSLGGLVCAEALVLGERNAVGDNVQGIAQCIQGLVFLATPFGGSNLAHWGDRFRTAFNFFHPTDGQRLETLKVESEELKQMAKSFQDTVRKRNMPGQAYIRIAFFYETLKTGLIQIVEEERAIYRGIGEALPLRANHLDICKFASKNDEAYKVVAAKIAQFSELIPASKNGDNIQNVTVKDNAKINNQGMYLNIASQTNNF